MSKAKQILKEYIKYYEDVQKIAIDCDEIKNRVLYINEAIAEIESQEDKSCKGCIYNNIPNHKWKCAIGYRCEKAWKNRYKSRAIS